MCDFVACSGVIYGTVGVSPGGSAIGDELLETIGAGFPDEPLLGEPIIEQFQAIAVEHAGTHPT